MSVKNRTFSAWSRDHHKTFAAAIAAELEKKADLDSPHFVGIPTAPTAEPGTKDNQIATTEFVSDAVGNGGTGSDDKVSKSGDTITGVLTIGLTPGTGGTNMDFPLVLKGKFNLPNALEHVWKLGLATNGSQFFIRYSEQNVVGFSPVLGIYPASNNGILTLGFKGRHWSNTFTKKINNGADINIPEKGGTLALVSDIEDTLRRYNLIPQEQETNEQN